MNELVTTYSNSFRIATGPFEVQLTFRIETPVIDEESGAITSVMLQPVADIRLNPSLAKNLSIALQQQVAEYEKQYGSIESSLILPEGCNE